MATSINAGGRSGVLTRFFWLGVCGQMIFGFYVLDASAFDLIKNRTEVNATGVRIIKENQHFQYVGSVNRHVRGGAQNSDLRSQGIFEGGDKGAGQSVPDVPGALYSGGIGIDKGFVLSTGIVSEDTTVGGTTIDFGMSGPNNGPNGDANLGEISHEFGIERDADFHTHTGIAEQTDDGDPTAIEFRVMVTTPGWLNLSYVFATEELPGHDDDDYNDSFAVIVQRTNGGSDDLAAGKNIATLRANGEDVAVQLARLNDNGLLKKNEFVSNISSDHHWPNAAPYYKHEFAAFTALRQCGVKLTPGEYRIRIVVQDVGDKIVDSALFIPDDGLTFEPRTVDQFCYQADFDRDGDVDFTDFLILSSNSGIVSHAAHSDGDADEDGDVDFDDYLILNAEYGLGT